MQQTQRRAHAHGKGAATRSQRSGNANCPARPVGTKPLCQKESTPQRAGARQKVSVRGARTGVPAAINMPRACLQVPRARHGSRKMGNECSLPRHASVPAAGQTACSVNCQGVRPASEVRPHPQAAQPDHRASAPARPRGSARPGARGVPQQHPRCQPGVSPSAATPSRAQVAPAAAQHERQQASRRVPPPWSAPTETAWSCGGETPAPTMPQGRRPAAAGRGTAGSRGRKQQRVPQRAAGQHVRSGMHSQ